MLNRSLIFTQMSIQRIISLAPSITETIFVVLGYGDKLVGVTEFCDWSLDAKFVITPISQALFKLEHSSLLT